MVVLTAIGRFFKKIWDWIKQTAWIQPLLIVGIIFGVIFSIRPIVDAVKKSKTEKSTYAAYYNKVDFLSLEGGENSKADKFTTALYDVMKGDKENLGDEFSYLGNKFFVIYVNNDCDECEAAKEGWATFEKNFKDRYDIQNYDYHLVSIFTDEETAQTTEDESAFEQYCARSNNKLFFEQAGDIAQNSDYFDTGKLNNEDVEQLIVAYDDYLVSPTIFLVELGDAAEERNPGITEVMFGVEGSDKNAKAETLLDCWNHDGDFSHDSKK